MSDAEEVKRKVSVFTAYLVEDIHYSTPTVKKIYCSLKDTYVGTGIYSPRLDSIDSINLAKFDGGGFTAKSAVFSTFELAHVYANSIIDCRVEYYKQRVEECEQNWSKANKKLMHIQDLAPSLKDSIKEIVT